jgi:hypothetical protein
MTTTIDLKSRGVQAPTGIGALANLVFVVAGGVLHVLEEDKYLVNLYHIS